MNHLHGTNLRNINVFPPRNPEMFFMILMLHLMATKIADCVSPPGAEGALFQHSVEVPVLRSELFKDLT